MTDRTDAKKTREGHEQRSWFEEFVETAHKRVSRAPFFFVCVAIVAVWLASMPLFHTLDSWQVTIHTVASVMTLLLLVLLENASRRAEEAAQEKLNVLAEALAALMDSRGADDPALLEAAAELRDAVGLEERH
jgi:low affinity Fe/Cu permease